MRTCMFVKNEAVTGFTFSLTERVTGAPVSTGTVISYYCIDGGTQAIIGDTPVHKGNGQWSVDLTADEMNGDVIGLLFTEASALYVSLTIKTEVPITVSEIASAVIDYDLTGYSTNSTFGAIQVRSAYNKEIHVDLTNDSGNAEAGTTFPTGMEHHPVNNIPDMLTLLDNFHLTDVVVMSPTLIPADTNLNGVCFNSNGSIDRDITIPDTATTNGTKFNNVGIVGYTNGKTEIINCDIEDLYNFQGSMEDSSVAGVLDLDDSVGALTTISNCKTGSAGIPDLIINGANVSISTWTGSINFESKTGSSVMGVSTGDGAAFNVKNSCTAGMIVTTGVGSVDVEEGTTAIVIDNMTNKENIAEHNWEGINLVTP